MIDVNLPPSYLGRRLRGLLCPIRSNVNQVGAKGVDSTIPIGKTSTVSLELDKDVGETETGSESSP